ncbi:hypothetical protein ABPG72_012892 [Tetrahymena utriculariae]
MKNKQLVYLRKPDITFPDSAENIFKFSESQIFLKTLNQGDYVVQVNYVSVDPVMRVWLSGAETYYPKLKSGDIMHCFGVGIVIYSKNSQINVGSQVFGNLGIQQYSVIDKSRRKMVFPLPSQQDFPSIKLKDYLYLVNNGMAAYMGCIEVCKPKAGQTILVSTAAGATGLLVCQLAKQKGCKVIGITGSQRKCDFLKNVIQIDEAINYKTQNLSEVLKNSQIDMYFDNVGEETLDLAIRQMNQNGRIALCGAMGNYNDYNNRKGIKNYLMIVLKRIFVKGITFTEVGEKMPEVLEEYSNNIKEGKLKTYFEEFESIEKLPEAVKFCFKGDNIGKVVVKIQDISFEEACKEVFKQNSLSSL